MSVFDLSGFHAVHDDLWRGSNGLKNGFWWTDRFWKVGIFFNGLWIPFDGSLAKSLWLLWWCLFADWSCLKFFKMQKVHFQLFCFLTDFNFEHRCLRVWLGQSLTWFGDNRLFFHVCHVLVIHSGHLHHKIAHNLLITQVQINRGVLDLTINWTKNVSPQVLGQFFCLMAQIQLPIQLALGFSMSDYTLKWLAHHGCSQVGQSFLLLTCFACVYSVAPGKISVK